MAEQPPNRPELPAGQTPPAAPPRPTLASPNAAPVLTKVTPPLSVRFTQFCWILSFVIGGFAIVYLFIIRKDQLPLIEDIFRGVDASRVEETYRTGADIIFWSTFGLMVGVILAQITLMVSFMSRRPGVRWWQLLTLVIQIVGYALAFEVITGGTRGRPLQLLFAAQVALVVLALLSSIMPKAMAWSARQHDVTRRVVHAASDGH